jgi:hypothetical protein
MIYRPKPSSRSPLYVLVLVLLGGSILCPAAGPPATKYPDAILRLTDNRQPFTPRETGVPYELPMKKLLDTQRGIPYGAAVRLTVEPLGEKLLVVDTAARGLLLKSSDTSGKDIVRIPEWVLPGPGLQTGVFKILGRLSWHELSLEPAVAELFQGKGYSWVDGILSTEVFSPWLVRLDFRKNRMSLLPLQKQDARARTEWEGRLDRNWWIVSAKIANKTAQLLLDSGAGRTSLSEEWIQRNFGDLPRHQRAAGVIEGKYHEAGMWKFEIDGAAPLHISCLYTGPGQLPISTGMAIDGVLGYDALSELALDLDYNAGKLYLLR